MEIPAFARTTEVGAGMTVGWSSLRGPRVRGDDSLISLLFDEYIWPVVVAGVEG